VLSSNNVARYREWKDKKVPYWTAIFLDCVASEFIEMSKTIPGVEKAVRFTEKGRALGIGQCGFHTLLQNEMIAFESLQAQLLSQEIAKLIWEESLEASKFLAKELGEPEWCKGLGVRNTHLIAIAPTKSTANLMGGVSEGINPDPAMVYTQQGSAGEIERVNLSLFKIMNDRGVWNKKTLKELKEKMGSVQHVDWLSDDEKKVFKTAFEINQEVILRMASARSAYVDQWMSLNLFFGSDEDPAWISHIHKLAFLDENILGLYYIYTQSGVQASKGECEACS
jgi:ribonucleoside-diphosphate reductase alpha chain